MEAKILQLVLMLNSFGADPAILEQYSAAVVEQCNSDPHCMAEQLALAWTETNFDPYQVSKDGACGIVQLMLDDEDPYDCPSVQADQALAVRLGLQELAKWKKNCGGDYLATYNRGYPYCCNGWYYPKRKHTKRVFHCEAPDLETHKAVIFRRNVERRTRIVRRWLRKGPAEVLECRDPKGKTWAVGVQKGWKHKALEHAGAAGLDCETETTKTDQPVLARGQAPADVQNCPPYSAVRRLGNVWSGGGR
jgi:hypothetical protein